MANIAVQRIKREFKEVLKSEEVSPALVVIGRPCLLEPVMRRWCGCHRNQRR